MKFLFLYLIVSALVSCSPKAVKKNSNSDALSYSSAIPYIYKVQEKPENAASFSDIDVTWVQLRGQDPALKELEDRLMKKTLVFAYAYAKMDLEKQNNQEASVGMTVYQKQPDKELSTVLQEAGVEPLKGIQVQFEESGDSSTIAQIGTKKIKFDDFLKANLSHAKMYQKVFNQRLRRLNGIVIRRSIFDAAKKENMQMEDYIQQKILGGEATEVSEEGVRKFAKERGISEGDLNEELLDRLKAIIRQDGRDKKLENYAAKNLLKTPVSVGFAGPVMKIETPNISSTVPTWGKGGASEIVYIGHWDCENCSVPLKKFLEAQKSLGQKAKGSFVFSFPLSNRESRMTAEASLCVHKQKEESFWSFLEKVQNEPKENIEESVNTAAKGVGVEYEEFRKCFLGREFQDVVGSHLKYVSEMGVFKTPLLVINGTVFESPFDQGNISQQLMAGTKTPGLSFFGKIKNFFSNLFS